MNIVNHFKEHGREYLVGCGLSCAVLTIPLTIEATRKADKIIKKEKLVTNKEKIVRTAPCYIPPTLSAIATVGCIIGVNSIGVRETTTALSSLALSNRSVDGLQKAFDKYRSTVKEEIGEEKEQKIADKAASVHYESLGIPSTGDGEILCEDHMTGRYFYSSPVAIEKAVNNINSRLLQEYYVSYNDMCMELKIPTIGMGDDIGWNLDNGMVELSPYSKLVKDIPVYVMNFRCWPRFEYAKLM